MPRERDMRDAVQAALLATNAFDNVYLSGLPENYGIGSSSARVAVVEPSDWSDDDRFDGGPATGAIRTDTIKITLIARDEDPQLRDEAAELLLEYARNAINGVALVPGFNSPDRTKLARGRWLPAQPPERRIEATLTYWYLISGWASNDTTP